MFDIYLFGNVIIMVRDEIILEKIKKLAKELNDAGSKPVRGGFHVLFTDVLLDIYEDYKFYNLPVTKSNNKAIEEYYFTLCKAIREHQFDSFIVDSLIQLEAFVYSIRRSNNYGDKPYWIIR